MKQNLIYLKNYNNYFNRKVKYGSALEDYPNNKVYNNNIDFNPNDGVSTKITANWYLNGVVYDWTPDYLLVTHKEQRGSLEVDVIDSRWFVMEFFRVREGQYEVTLRRDVIADHYQHLLDAPIFVEKSVIKDPENELVFNKENFICNQIKKNEVLLKDETGCPWLVAYLVKGTVGEENIASTETSEGVARGYGSVRLTTQDGTETYEGTIEQWLEENGTKKVSANSGIKYYWYYINQVNFIWVQVIRGNNSGNYNELASSALGHPSWSASTSLRYAGSDTPDKLNNAVAPHLSNYNSVARTKSNTISTSTFNTFYDRYNGKVLQTLSGSYRITIKPSGGDTFKSRLASSDSLGNSMVSDWNSGLDVNQYNNGSCFQVEVNYQQYSVTAEKVEDIGDGYYVTNGTGGTLPLSLSGFKTSAKTNTALFDVVCIPYGEIPITITGVRTVTSNKEEALACIMAYVNNLTDAMVLDLQLLPYCPVRQFLNVNNGLTVSISDLIRCVKKVGEGVDDWEEIAPMIVVPKTNVPEFNIYQSFSLPDNSIETIKYYNECTLMRLCSPNYNGSFDFNLARNKGVSFFNVDMTLKPQTPYIHVNPNFQGLYGADYNDARGLICGGDFSLGILKNKWIEYQIQNKNYQSIFDRQIQSLDIKQNWDSIMNNYKGITGTAGSIMGGIMKGTKQGGIAEGMIQGSILGAIAGTGYGLSRQRLVEEQLDTREYTIDNFNMQLGNVQALPLSLTRVDSLTANNKIFPFVEVYECSDVEKQAFLNKLKYDGMRIGAIGTLKYYVPDLNSSDLVYFKGKIIIIDTIIDDQHMLQCIYDELNAGVYLTPLPEGDD